MTLTDTRTYSVRPIDADAVDQLRIRDDAGNPPRSLVETTGGNPLRCCLRLSRTGERVLLASYAPLRRWAVQTGADPGAYDEVGPVFIHAEPCLGPADDDYPAELLGSPRVLRAYDATGRIVGGILVAEGDEPEPAIARLLADPAVAIVHARALEFGCFTFAIERI